jgi:hypothetical protein
MPPGLQVPPNPPMVMGNVAGFERLLMHDRNARVYGRMVAMISPAA